MQPGLATRRRSKGFTLVEMVLALAIGTVILGGAVRSIYQVLVTSSRGINQVIALSDANIAALIIKNDLLMARTTNLGSTPVTSANLSWTDYTSSFGSSFQTLYSVNYSL